MSLEPLELRLIDLSVAIVQGDWQALAELRRAAPPGEPNRAWREAALQCHLFAGFPRLVEAYEVLERNGGLGGLEPDEERAEPDLHERGAELFDRIYGKSAAVVRSKLATYHPDFARWIAGHAYGRVLTRPGLSARTRELLACASLAVSGQERQLASHMRGALRCGAERAELEAVLARVVGQLGEERLRAALRLLPD